MPELAGWTKRYRKVEKWEWYKNSHMVHLFGHLIGRAARKPEKWQGHPIKRGQLITGRKALNQETGISERTIRTCLSNLEKTGEIRRETTSKFTLITVCNYDIYQNQEEIADQQTDQQPTSNRPASDQQPTTNKKNIKKNIKKVKNKREIIYPFDNPEFLETWELWKRFKKEQFRFTYKPIGEQAALKNIADLANGNLNTAIEIIHQSIKNGWQGFFAKKGGFNQNTDLTEYKQQITNEMNDIINKYGKK